MSDRVFKYTVLVVLAFASLVVLRLLFFEQTVPKALLDYATGRLSEASSNFLFTAESASFRFSRGVTIRNIRVFDRNPHPMRVEKTKPLVMSASRVDLGLDLRHIPWSRESIIRDVTLEDFTYPRLPEGYYIPDSIEKPGQPDFREVDEAVGLELPRMRPFRVRLIRPDILSVTPKYVDIPRVQLMGDGLRADGIHLRLPDSDTPVALDGRLEVDFSAQLVRGEVHGLVRQHNIRPMLVALDITNSYQFIDAFTNVEPPVPAICRYDVNLRNNDLHLFLDLHPVGGRYNGVPLKNTDGTLDIRVFVRDIYQNADIHVDLSRVDLADGSSMKGLVRYANTNDVGFVDFDVDSRTSLSNGLAIADVLNDGTLDSLCITGAPPRITLKGRVARSPELTPHLNDLAGTLSFDTGSLFGVPLRNVSTRFNVKGSRISFSGSQAKSVHGGRVTGNAELVFRKCWTPPAGFTVNLACTNTPLTDIGGAFGLDVGEKRGYADGHVTLKGPVGSNAVERLCGSGQIVCRDGRLAQMRVFSGLTSFLSRRVLGGAKLEEAASLDFSRSSCDFTLSNGVFRTSNMVVEGRVLSIAAIGSYDIPRNQLDFSVRVKLLKWDLGGLTKPISWVSESLLDFKVAGPIEEPKWTYSKNPLRLLDLLSKRKPSGP